MKLKNWFVNKNGRKIWIHASSVGELDQAKAIASVIRNREKNASLILSVYSNSVTEKQLQNSGFDFSFYLPLDILPMYSYFMKKLQPDILIIVAWDTWPSLIHSAFNHGCKIYLACATLFEESSRTKFPAIYLYKSVFRKITGISPNHEIFIPAFRKMTERTEIYACGDSRVDSVTQKILTQKPNSSVSIFFNSLKNLNKNIIILGSTYTECEEIIIPQILDIDKKYSTQFWVFPHKTDEARIQSAEERLKNSGLRYSVFSKLDSSKLPELQVILFDVMGILAFAYQYSLITYIGGGFGKRIHNVLEPAYFGQPIITGPKIQHAAEAVVFQMQGGLKVIHNGKEFAREVIQLLSSREILQKKGETNRRFLDENAGASERFYRKFLENKST